MFSIILASALLALGLFLAWMRNEVAQKRARLRSEEFEIWFMTNYLGTGDSSSLLGKMKSSNATRQKKVA